MDEIRDLMGVRPNKAMAVIVWILDFTLKEMRNHWKDVSERVHGLIGLLKESLY